MFQNLSKNESDKGKNLASLIREQSEALQNLNFDVSS